jgi:hypothetical protein
LNQLLLRFLIELRRRFVRSPSKSDQSWEEKDSSENVFDLGLQFEDKSERMNCGETCSQLAANIELRDISFHLISSVLTIEMIKNGNFNETDKCQIRGISYQRMHF